MKTIIKLGEPFKIEPKHSKIGLIERQFFIPEKFWSNLNFKPLEDVYYDKTLLYPKGFNMLYLFDLKPNYLIFDLRPLEMIINNYSDFDNKKINTFMAIADIDTQVFAST